MGTPSITYPAPGAFNPIWSYDATINVSAKTWTVGQGKMWVLKYAFMQLTATATVGNRVLGLTITDGANTVLQASRSGNITATQTGTYRIDRSPSSGSTAANLPLLSGATPNVAKYSGDLGPDGFLLPAGYVVKLWDTNAIDAAADDCIFVLYAEEYSIPYGNV